MQSMHPCQTLKDTHRQEVSTFKLTNQTKGYLSILKSVTVSKTPQTTSAKSTKALNSKQSLKMIISSSIPTFVSTKTITTTACNIKPITKVHIASQLIHAKLNRYIPISVATKTQLTSLLIQA